MMYNTLNDYNCIENMNEKEISVAFLLYGQARIKKDDYKFFDCLDKIRHSFKNSDVYSHVWFDKDVKKYDVSTWAMLSDKSGEVDPEVIDKIKSRIDFVKLEIEAPRKFSIPPHLLDKYLSLSVHLKVPINSSNLMSQLYSIQKVCNMPEKKYDWYVLLRYDVQLQYLPNFRELDKNKIYKHVDWVQIVSHENFHFIKNVYDKVPNYNGNIRQREMYLSAESIRLDDSRENGVEEVDLPADVLVWARSC